MKTILKVAAIAALFLVSSVAASAQIKVGAYGTVGMPTGDLADMYKTGFSGGLAAKYMINDNMSAGLSFANYKLAGEEMSIDFGFGSMTIPAIDLSITAITANYSYYFGTEGFKPYAGLDLGSYMFKADVSGAESESYLGLAPVVGFEYAFTDAIALDANFKYNYIMTDDDATKIIGVNIGVIYSFGE